MIYVQGVFCILAENEDEFLERKSEFVNWCELDINGCDDYEKDEEGGIYKVTCTGQYNSIKELKLCLKEAESFDFVLLDNSYLMDENGKYLFLDGKWKV